MKISSTALKVKRSFASGYRWFTRSFKSPAEYKSVIDARVDDACWLLDQFGPVQSVLVVDDISAQAFVYVDERNKCDFERIICDQGGCVTASAVR